LTFRPSGARRLEESRRAGTIYLHEDGNLRYSAGEREHLWGNTSHQFVASQERLGRLAEEAGREDAGVPG
jgi:hypothetical protein